MPVAHPGDASNTTVHPVNYAARRPTRKNQSLFASQEFRRTLIPPCLVVGATFLLLMLIFFMLPASAALRQASIILPVGLGVTGLLLLGLGVLNMILVKKELDAAKAAKPAGTA